jgi:CDP-diacylglycerol--glycerol-3-phosphate 3-phosphatidyltransferase
VSGLRLVDTRRDAGLAGGLAASDVRRRRLANLTSGLGAALCIAAGASLAAGLNIYAVAVLFSLGAICDLADGRIARSARRLQPSRSGAFIDSFCDKVGEAGIFVGLLAYLHEPVTQLLAAMAFAVGWLTSWAKAFAEAQQFDINWSDARILGRATRATLLSLTLFVSAVLSSNSYAVWIMGFIVLLVFNCTTLMSRLVRIIETEARQKVS